MAKPSPAQVPTEIMPPPPVINPTPEQVVRQMPVWVRILLVLSSQSSEGPTVLVPPMMLPTAPMAPTVPLEPKDDPQGGQWDNCGCI